MTTHHEVAEQYCWGYLAMNMAWFMPASVTAMKPLSRPGGARTGDERLVVGMK